jgi:hypothetical protein
LTPHADFEPTPSENYVGWTNQRIEAAKPSSQKKKRTFQNDNLSRRSDNVSATITKSVARRHADENSIIFEEDLDSEGELTVLSAFKGSAYQADFDLDEENFGI